MRLYYFEQLSYCFSYCSVSSHQRPCVSLKWNWHHPSMHNCHMKRGKHWPGPPSACRDTGHNGDMWQWFLFEALVLCWEGHMCCNSIWSQYPQTVPYIFYNFCWEINKCCSLIQLICPFWNISYYWLNSFWTYIYIISFGVVWHYMANSKDLYLFDKELATSFCLFNPVYKIEHTPCSLEYDLIPLCSPTCQGF